jgi:hypothetical protein
MRGVTLSVWFAVAMWVSTAGPVHASQSTDSSSDDHKAYRTKTGKTIIVSETHPAGRSLSTIEIRTRGFEHEYHEIYPDRNPISDVFVADLDGNGFDEIYIITTSAGSGSYGTVLGFASNKDKSLSMIHFPEIREGDENFEGYMGHDTFKIEDQKLVRIFPIYNRGDTNENPKGGRRKLVYGLYPGEAMWQLEVEEAEDLTVFTGEAKILQSWHGDYPVARLDLLPEKQREQPVGFINDAKTFEGVWIAFQPAEPVPQIDFTTNLVLFARNTRFYNRIRIGRVNVTNGVAEVLAMETLSALPIEEKAAMSMVVVSRKNIKSIRIPDGLITISGPAMTP